MNIQQLLQPLIENTDYSIQNGEPVALPKTRQVEQIISHPEIAAVAGQSATQEVPATFDEEGNELTPLIPAQEEIVAVEFQAAYDEVLVIEETYYENIPSMDEVKASAISDVALAIEEYLADKSELRDPENDSINIVDNRIFSWGFTNIPQPSVDELYDAYLAKLPKVEQAEINAAALKYLADTDYLIIRELDSGVLCPADIKLERAAARSRIVR